MHTHPQRLMQAHSGRRKFTRMPHYAKTYRSQRTTHSRVWQARTCMHASMSASSVYACIQERFTSVQADVSSSRAILHKSPPTGHPCISFVRSASSYPCGHWHCEPIILSRVCGRSEWPLMRVLVLVRPRAVFALDLAP